LDSLASKERVDAVLERGAQAGEPDVVAEKLAQLAQLARRHVGLGEQIGAQKVGERARVDGVRLHPRGGDRLRVPRMAWGALIRSRCKSKSAMSASRLSSRRRVGAGRDSSPRKRRPSGRRARRAGVIGDHPTSRAVIHAARFRAGSTVLKRAG
jgi:hypothetical protein